MFGGDDSVILTTAANACNAGLGVGSPLPHIYVFDARAQLYEKHFCFEIRHKGLCSHYYIWTTQTLGMGTQLLLPFAAENLSLAVALEKAVAW